jgi:hypothetical protein
VERDPQCLFFWIGKPARIAPQVKSVRIFERTA